MYWKFIFKIEQKKQKVNHTLSYIYNHNIAAQIFHLEKFSIRTEFHIIVQEEHAIPFHCGGDAVVRPNDGHPRRVGFMTQGLFSFARSTIRSSFLVTWMWSRFDGFVSNFLFAFYYIM